MTKSVIRQRSNLEIATKSVTAHVCAMEFATNILADMRSEMRPEKIGTRLRLLRLAYDLSPSQMAESLNIERTYWSRFEKGHRAPNDETLTALVARYDVTLDFLLLGRWDRLPFELAERMRAIVEK